MADSAEWHSINLAIPFPTVGNAELVKNVIEVDPVLKPSELKRSIVVDGSTLQLSFKARTVAQARVALDHCLSDVQLIVQTMHKFAPKDLTAESGVTRGEDAPSLEVGLKGQWDGIAR